MKTDPHSTDPAARVTELTVAIKALQQHDAAFLREQILLEQGGARPVAPALQETAGTARQRWLNGHASGVVAENKDVRLHQIRIDRAGIEGAIGDLQTQLFDAKATAFHAWMRQNEKRWNAAQRKRCQALLDLRAANRECAKFREEATAVSPGALSLPCDRISGLFGLPIVEDPQYRFLKACVEAGIISAQEMGVWQ
jgi:hypothetical protein